MSSIPYKVALSEFVGPMDLLVYLVKQRELDIAYISVSQITADYLLFWQHYANETVTNSPSKLLELDPAGEFVFLAAMLLEYKAAQLLPGEESELEFESHAVWRERLIEELKNLEVGISRLASLEERQLGLFDSGGVVVDGLDERLGSEVMSSVSLLDIARAFQELTISLPIEPLHIVPDIPYTIEGQIGFVLSFFRQTREITFNTLAESLHSRIEVIVTFLAILELMRQRKIAVSQQENFGILTLTYTGKPQS